MRWRMPRLLLRQDTASGVVLFAAALSALVIDNSPLASFYDHLLALQFSITLGDVGLSKPLLLWINDGLMALFFLLVGMEIKREVMQGKLSSRSKAALPVIAAIGGMIVPAAVYLLVTGGDPALVSGWAIPAATDIAFALAVLAVLGTRVPVALKTFLAALAIIDDIGAIVIIALFYTAHLSLVLLGLAALCVIGLIILNQLHVTRIASYVLLGGVLWICVLQSGVHATLAGVVLAFAIPLERKGEQPSPLEQLERDITPAVFFGVMPLFAFANAGVPLGGVGWGDLLSPLTLGIAAGLFIGKQVGVFAFAWAAVRLGLAHLPEGVNYRHLYGTALLTGIGFTMSLFIGALAFDGPEAARAVRIGVLVGSFLAGVAGYLVLRSVSAPAGVADAGPDARRESRPEPTGAARAR